MNDWIEGLYRELDEWNDAGVEATLWWRDDDAQAPSAALERVIGLAQTYAAPVALAVIPQHMAAALAGRVRRSGPQSVAVLQHGFSHHNHAPPGEKKMELGHHRPPAEVHSQLAAGFAALESAFEAQFVPVLTPPWNRIAPGLLEGLAGTGFTGLSTFGPRHAMLPGPGLCAVNTHVDIIDWKRHKRFVGAPRAAEGLVAHLSGRRLGRFDREEPTGLLTHHLVHDRACWDFLGQLLAALDDHPAVRWLRAAEVFAARR